MLSTVESDISTILLTYPLSIFEDVNYFEKFTECLDQALTKESANFQDEIQLVFFHPKFKFTDKDGQVMIVFDDEGNPLGRYREFIIIFITISYSSL